MYAHIEMAVRPSLFLVRCHCLIHFVLMFSTLIWLDIQQWLYCVPLWCAQLVFIVGLFQSRFEFQKSAFWLHQNGRWQWGYDRNHLLPVAKLYVDRRLPFLTVVKFKLGSEDFSQKTRWQMLVRDRVESESFRQFRVMLKKHDLIDH